MKAAKEHLTTLFALTIIIIGVGIFFYPNISNWYMQAHQGKVIQKYDQKAEKLTKKKISEMKEKVRYYNENLINNRTVLTDPFDEKRWKELTEDYKELLNLDDVMAYIEIPKIDVYLPIYHGTEKETLEKGIGHLQNTSLPLGGKGTHCVISGHSGLSNALYFTNLDRLKKNDMFYIHVLDEILAYKVCRIKVVEPDDIKTLSIDPQKDYVTLVTCTPFGQNTHRLLVTGKRTKYVKKDITKAKKLSLLERLELLIGHRKNALQLLGAGSGIIIFYLIFIFYRKKNKLKE